MKGIIVGSIVLCKMLTSQPNMVNEKEFKEAKSRNYAIDSVLGKTLLKGKDSLEQKKEAPKLKEELVSGVVTDIEEKDFWIELDNGKYKKERQKYFYIKNDKYHVIKFGESSCGLYSDLTKSNKKVISLNKNKKKVTIENSKDNKYFIEEYYIVPVDYKLKQNEIEVTDNKIKEKLKKVILKELSINNNFKTNKDEYKDLAIKKKEKKEVKEKKEEKVISDNKKEIIPKEIKKEPSLFKERKEEKSVFKSISEIENIKDKYEDKENFVELKKDQKKELSIEVLKELFSI